MTPQERLAQSADLIAKTDVQRAQRSMDTQAIKAAIERKRATNHALMAVQLREARESSTQERMAAE